MSAPLLEVKNLRVEFPTRRGTLLALDDISFDIAPGEVLGVVGESGAGKSLTGAAIIGLLEPPGRIAGGEIRLAGQRIERGRRDAFSMDDLTPGPAMSLLRGDGALEPKAWVERATRSLVFAQGELRRPDGALAASASAVFRRAAD